MAEFRLPAKLPCFRGWPRVDKSSSVGITNFYLTVEMVKKNGNVSRIEIKAEEPKNWREVYGQIKAMKSKIIAPVDNMGCHTLADRKDPKVFRLQTLVALMLSSQTKDTVLGPTMKNLKENMPKGLTVEGLEAIDEKELNILIEKVGFHNRKAMYLKKTAKILKEKYDGDIPDTIEGLMELPGVGPKMGYLCLGVAWNKIDGIGVDVHVHRISNLLGWVHTKTEEQTRLALQSWLPKELWLDVNHMLVGFGQMICLPRGRRCDICTLAENNLCPSAFTENSRISKQSKKGQAKDKRDLVADEDEDKDDKLTTRKTESPSLSPRDEKPAVLQEDERPARPRRAAFERSHYFSKKYLEDIEDLV
ncbi:DNA endonuclease III [Schizosaccharomyces japonicus yFS275]|uniref:Endonuclease III homolog n=1 Tax=Schizosaccharomyces japonicus (strain yFS275 / FY16936) TaxID=402676 RepID=B6K2S6_SCHJY|nr:DNA endonuclease III [Schizosaccharomyces japonicus yFS275]EEB08566.1 DNA endonuclease III [Schizosaccharomyces japonicus yFS275]